MNNGINNGEFKVGLTAGSFDLIHPGYIAQFSFMRDYCDRIVVALHIDPSIERPEKNKPINTVSERAIVLKALRYVDEIVPYETEKDLENILKTKNIDVYFMGEDWRDKNYTGKNLECGFNVIWIPRNHDYSTSKLREKIYNIEETKLDNHKFNDWHSTPVMINDKLEDVVTCSDHNCNSPAHYK